MSLYLGFDPGGNGSFGVAVMVDNHIQVTTVSTIDAAVEWTIANCPETPMAAGIDSLLQWSTGNGPAVDWKLRRCPRYKPTRLSVTSQNSLYGSMVIGGMGLAHRLREKWPSILLNETHPKVLYYALAKEAYPRLDIQVAAKWLLSKARIVCTVDNDHEFDAAISAWATKAALHEKWDDLIDRTDKEIMMPIPKVHYFWPEKLD